MIRGDKGLESKVTIPSIPFFISTYSASDAIISISIVFKSLKVTKFWPEPINSPVLELIDETCPENVA